MRDESTYTTTPTTFLQEEWFRAIGGTRSNHLLPVAIDIHGALDQSRLEVALQSIVRRHDVLRSVVEIAPETVRYIVDREPWWVRLALSDFAATPEEWSGPHRYAELERVALILASETVDVTRQLWSAHLVRMSHAHHVLVLAAHHAIMDGWSSTILAAELARAYAADDPAALPWPAPVQIGEYAKWERALTLDSDKAAFWREQLRGPLPELPTDPTVTGDGVTMVAQPLTLVGPAASLALRSLAESRGLRMRSALEAVVIASLLPYAGDAITVGQVVPGRDHAQGLKSVVGLLSDHLPMRVALEGRPTFLDLVERTHAADLAARAHRSPLGVIGRGVGRDDPTMRRRVAAGRLFDVSINYMPQKPPQRPPVDTTGLVRFSLAHMPNARLTPRMAQGFSGAPRLGYQLKRGADGTIGGELWAHSPLLSRGALDRLVRGLDRTIYAVLAEPCRPLREIVGR